MPSPRITPKDQATLDKFGFELKEPPKFAIVRKSRHTELYAAAIAVAKKFPGQSLKIRSFDNGSSPNILAKQINNDERPEFLCNEGEGSFSASYSKDNIEGSSFSVYIKYNSPDSIETETDDTVEEQPTSE